MLLSSRSPWRTSIVSLVLCCGLLVPVAAARGEAATATNTAEVALQSFNDTMRRLYGTTRAALAAQRPLIVVGSDITLLTSNGQITEQYTPALYTQMKSFGHVVLGLVGALVPPAADWAQKLAEIRDSIQALWPQISHLGLTPAQERRQDDMLIAVKDFIDVALRAQQVDPVALAGLLKRLQPMLMENAEEGAIAQLQRLHQVVSGWRKTLSPEEWAKIRVLVCGPRGPRPQNLQVAYFLRLLGEREEGGRVVYTENVYDQAGMIDKLGTLLADRSLSALVYGTPYRMDTDLLGYIAGDYLDRILP